MPKDYMFRITAKYCEMCGNPLILNNSRDLQRKRFCSRKCSYEVINPTQYVLPHSLVTREKMRQSKIELLKTGWIPVGWRKYLPQRRIGSRGYAFVGQKREHQIIMENKLGRPLALGEVVHHMDGDKTNNDVNNLQLMTRGEHIKYHLKQRRLTYVTAGF